MTAWQRLDGGYGKGTARAWDMGEHGWALEHRGKVFGITPTLAQAQRRLDDHLRATDGNEVGVAPLER